jgi:hypothetical protein
MGARGSNEVITSLFSLISRCDFGPLPWIIRKVIRLPHPSCLLHVGSA